MYSRRRFLAVVLTAVLLPTLSAGTTVFKRRWHWYEASVGRSVVLTADGGYVVGAGTWLGGADYGATLAWVDSLGEIETVRHIAGLDDGAGYLCRVEDGGYVLAGTRDTLHVFAQKFDAAGDSVWTYVSPTRGRVSAVLGAPDGGCLIVGRIPDSMYDMGAIKLDSAGGEEWTRYYEEPGVFASMALGAALTRDGGYILCGEAHDYMDSYTRLVRTDSAGVQKWSRLYFGAPDAALYDVSQTTDGGFLAAGLELDTLAARNALYLLRVDSTGAPAETRSFAPPGAATRAAAIDTACGGYVVAGQIDWGDSARVWLVKLDADADTAWTSVLPGSSREHAEDVRQTPGGGYVVAGVSDSAGGSVLLIKTDSLGGVMTGVAKESPAARERIAFSVAPNPASGVVKVEWSLPARSPAILSLYDALGRQIFSSPELRTSPFEVRTSSLPQGVYLLRLEHGSGFSTLKLVID